MRKSIRRILFVLLHSLGFVLLYLVVRKLDWGHFFELIKTFPWWSFGLGLAMLMLVYLLKSWRWYIINKAFGIDIPFGTTLTFFLVSGFLSAITPGRIGEFSKIFFISRKYPVSYSQSTSSVFLDRIWDVLVLSLMGGAGILFFFSRFQTGIATIVIILLLFAGSLLAVLVPSLFFRPAVFLTGRWPGLQNELVVVERLWKENRTSFFIPAFILTILAFLVLASIPVIFTTATGTSLPYPASVSAVAVSNMLSFIPVTVAGFGTREYVFIKVWQVLGKSAEVAVTISTVYFMATYLGSILIGGIIYLVRFRKHFSMKEIRKNIEAD
ncbi:MAG TPA: lysylphosphatidylglycerol synthase transmembrane domain-containing protein [Bacteroidales bacterium]|nr:lysylphosphatidylglycerol synthase transmembrane domain-containing protein [Bacteroidales bacterium]